ncbi:hypothetical protein GCM10018954_043260 [Kutzneria kofuensis]
MIASPVQDLRQLFDLMPTETAEQWSTIATRLTKVPQALAGLRASLAKAADRGVVSALRQVTRVAEQCDTWAGLRGGSSFFATMIARAEGVDDALRTRLETGANAAAQGYADLATFLRDELAPKAPAKDAVGVDVYRLNSRYFTGAQLDLQEAYEWGWEEFSRIETEMKQVANRIRGGATTLAEARRGAGRRPALPSCTARTRCATGCRGCPTRPWPTCAACTSTSPPVDGAGMQDRAARRHRRRVLHRPDRRLQPAGARCGGRCPPTARSSHLARDHHRLPRGVPGHHLQFATAVYRADQLNRFQRLMCWVSGHGEGWALYAERLVRELGYLDDDGDLLGMLDGPCSGPRG